MPGYRIRFSKEPQLKYLSHLELIKAVERAARRAQLPLAYSEGYHPHPKFSFGPALAVGISSTDEYFDLELTKEYSPETLTDLFNRNLPEGIRILTLKRIPPNHHLKPLNAIINRASYAAGLKPDPADLGEVISFLMELKERPEIPVTRRSKDGEKIVNIRPWLHNLSTEAISGNTLILNLTGEIGSGGHLRPEDVIQLIPFPVELLYISRQGLWHEEKGKILKPLDFCEKTGGTE